ncbi:MAG: methyltransferase domain-containing protein [Litoreibacter sp.]|nr:methyltransferase domain-containing protein [Litoreibacter sp.]
MSFSDDELSRDDFLGGQLKIWQPLKGYRAATDPVFLAAACPAKSGEDVLELGCGAGTASLCLARRVEVHLTGVELQEDYAKLARRNAHENDVQMEVIAADLTRLPAPLKQRSFDQVILNPPYFGAGTPSDDTGRDIALREQTPIAAWVDSALKRLKPRGWLTVIHRPEALSEILAALISRAGAIEIKPLSPRAGRPANRVIIRARKEAKAATQLLNPLILHEGAQHQADGNGFTPQVEAILRDGEPLEF